MLNTSMFMIACSRIVTRMTEIVSLSLAIESLWAKLERSTTMMGGHSGHYGFSRPTL